VKCPDHGVKQAKLPWAEKGFHIMKLATEAVDRVLRAEIRHGVVCRTSVSTGVAVA